MEIKRTVNLYFKIFIDLLLLIVSVTIMLQPAIYNQYPLCHPDLLSYLSSGFDNIVHPFRPFFYGVIIRHISMGYSLWFVIIFQAFIFSLTLYLVYRYVFRYKNSMLLTLISTAILSALTTVSFYTCHLIPDIYSGFGILAIILLLNTHKNHWLLTVYAVILLIVSGLVHYSNIGAFNVIIVLSFIFFIIFIRKDWNPFKFKQLVIPIVVVISLWFLMPLLNFINGGPSRITSNNEVIHMARLIETGIASEYLHEKCGEYNYDLCNYLDYVDSRHHPSVFVWNYNDSPLYKGNCKDDDSCWEQKSKEYKLIINDMIKTAKYRNMIIWRIGIVGSFKQFVCIGHQPLQRQSKNTPGYMAMQKYFPNEFKKFNTSVQQSREWTTFKIRNIINRWAVIFGFIIIVLFLIVKPLRKRLELSHYLFLSIVLLYLIVNAATCSVFSSISPRYQDRIIWLIPFSAILLLTNYLSISKEE